MTVKSVAKKIWLSLNAIRFIPHIFFMKLHSSRECIILDIERWSSLYYPGKRPETAWDIIWSFIQLMTFKPEYRSIFYYRLGWISWILYPLCRPMYTPWIGQVDEGIGPGLITPHGWAVGVQAKKVGKNCWIYPDVLIGFINDTDKPTIGDNVTISVGAKILGNVKVGDNSIVGANAVVLKDVPENCTVVGVPAYIIRRNGVKVNEPL